MLFVIIVRTCQQWLCAGKYINYNFNNNFQILRFKESNELELMGSVEWFKSRIGFDINVSYKECS